MLLNIKELSSFCQELVEAVSRLLGGKTINIMDLSGTIVASTDKSRIGDIHTGAKHVVSGGHDLAITEELLPNYPGAKVGYNMPLTFHGKIIGAIGMFGPPEQVRDLTKLLKIYADKYFELQGTMEAKLVDLSIRSKLFGLLTAENADIKNIEDVMEMLDVSFVFPVTFVRISKRNTAEEPIPFEKILSSLISCKLIDTKHDFWSLEADSLSIICSSEIKSSDLQKIEEISECRIIIPRPAADYSAISKASTDALWIDKHMDEKLIDLEDPRSRLKYMMYQTAFSNSDIIDSFIDEMRRYLTENSLRKCMEAVKSYYDESMSVTEAAESLGIHKNTLQARVKRVMEAAGIEDYPITEKIYLMNLIHIRLQLLSRQSEEAGKA